jgi:2-(1,2-epoxy-1,2-dihydrophenyl)acetyl-CoA isomerase
MDFTYIRYGVMDRVGVITLNRPEVLNALGGTMREELLQALQRSETDPEVRCVMITGAGRAFCAGGDISNMVELQAQGNTAPMEERMAVGAKVIQQIRRMPKPIMAAVNGAAAGAGMNLALACDLRWGSDRARFAESFVKIGLAPDWGGTYFLTRLIGTSRAMELMMTGDPIEAEEALRLGIINRVLPHEAFYDEALNFARRLAAGPAAALAQIKRGVYLGATGTLEEALEHEQQAQLGLFLSTTDAQEGTRAFLEKRQPVFGQER